MDIVDTFNHLIPTEHLDDALFLGSNLESEGCDEFATGQHVIEDSLKNMLSDKDPMLGSASTQFCLPVLDNADNNFQIPPSTGVGLDDIMDVRVDKVTAVDINDDDDLILPGKNLNRLNEPSIKSLRKSPRLKAQESTITLRPSTIEKTLNAAKVTSPIKSKSSRKDTAADKAKEKEDILHTGSDDKTSNSTQNSRRSTRIANKEQKDTDQNNLNKTTSGEESSTINEILSNTQSILVKNDGNSETLHNDSLVLSSANSNRALEEVPEHGLNNPHGDRSTDDIIEAHVEEKVYNSENYQTDDKKTDVIYDKVHQELALLSGVVECDLGVKTVLPPRINVECMLQNAVGSSVQECEPDKNSIASEALNTSSKANSLGDMSIVEHLVQNCSEEPESAEKGHPADKEMSAGNDFGKPNCNRQGSKKLKPSSAKVPISTENSTIITVSAKDSSFYPLHQKGELKKTNVTLSESSILLDKSKIIKVTKKRPVSAKIHNIPMKATIKKKPHSGEKKGNLSTLLNQIDDTLQDNQGSSKETSQVVSVHIRSRSLSHSSDKSVTKQPSTKVTPYPKDVGEQKEAAEHLEEKTKLKKSLPPRQRRSSSKSVSVEEPPLFIPDNIPTVKKEGAEVTSPTDKYIWNPTRHCSSCRKLHGNRFMVGCGRCDDWFHGDCVGLSLAQAQQMEVDDKEYICIKCCVEEEKMDTSESFASSDSQKPDLPQEHKTLDNNKPVTTSCSGVLHEKSKQADDTIKHKVKISKKSSGDNKQVSERKDLEIKKHASDRKSGQSATASHRVSEEKRERSLKDSAASPPNDEKTPKPGASEKQDVKRKKPEKKVSSSALNPSPSTPKPSVDQIRQSVRQSLKDILLKRLSQSSSKIPEERATKVSVKIEKELFSFYRDTDSKYKNKYRSLMFNLKDPKNNVLYKRVLRGDITPEHLIKMTPEELASKELAAWRQRENRHTIEMIEKEQREVERRPITKITHKGEIEIESDAPNKEPEAMDTEESVVKTIEKEEEVHKDKDPPTESTLDTTAQHKNHLFDLNCKICTGRMAPPAEDMSPKKGKLSMGAIRKQSEEYENVSEPSAPGNFKIDILEAEKPESPKEQFFSAASSDPFNITETVEDESAFLSRLTYIWKGFLNMPSVAKFIIKAYPVSGSLDHLSEDLPDSIQVGGRISPQTVWDYVEKIKASGTKETCVIRFCPETEEDQISYTLLYSYFSSRKRYGVVANNMRQVKDMYLIPLGASEKIPHFFVPFDGPGLETRRPNLLLALIIRQKVKRQHSTSLDEDQLGTLMSVPEKKSRNDVADEDDDDDEDENDFFNSFSAVLHKSRNRPQVSDNDEPQASVESVPEAVKREPPKPLRFLPGVLVGWENPQSTIDLANKPLPVDDILQSLLGTTKNTFEHKPPVTAVSDQSIKEVKKQIKDETITTEPILDKDLEMDITPNLLEETKENPTPIVLTQSEKSAVSLKDKPPDVSTEVYLAKINAWSSDEAVECGNSTGPDDLNQDIEDNVYPNLSPVHENKSSIDSDNTSTDTSPNPVKPSKSMHIKRDPRQAATRSHINSPDSKDFDMSKNEEDAVQDKELRKHSHEESDLLTSRSDSLKSSLCFASAKNEAEIAESLITENTKQYPQDLLIDETDPLQQFRRALAANKSQSQTSNSSQTEMSSKNTVPSFTGSFSPLRLQQPSFLPLKSNPPPFPFQHTPSFPLQANPLFSYPPHIPPLLPTPLGINFPRPPRFQSVEPSIHNPLVAWHPTLQIPRPPHFFGSVASGPLLNSEQVRYQAPQKPYQKDHRVQERRHSDPWDKQDRARSLNRGSRGEHRQRFYSESHHSREKRHEKESGSEKHGDKDSERSRRRDKEKEKSHDRDRKSHDESHREKERSRASHSDKSSDRKTSKERRSSDKSKAEDHSHDKDKTRDKNREREDEKEKDRHHKDRSRDHSDKSKSKR